MNWRNRISNLIVLGVMVGPFLTTECAQARPEYAAKQRVNCSSCHANPWGGGPRTVYGKIFGSRNLGAPKTNNTDLYYGDMRLISFFPTQSNTGSNGVALMEAAATANVPVIQSDNSEVRAVATYNFAPLQGLSGPREVYVRIRPGTEENSIASHIVVGRFNSPFGLLTDEHRTYVRIQNNTTLNTFLAGAALSGNISEALHFDVAITNDLNGGGGFNSNGNAFGETANLRWSPEALPGFIGVSQSIQYASQSGANSPSAYAAYAVASIDRATDGKIPLTVLGEVDLSRNWNNSIQNSYLNLFFFPSSATAYQTTVAQSQSLGYYVEAKMDLSNRWRVFYKFDYLALDSGYLGDAFSRHGLGFEVNLNSNMILNARFEKALVGRPEIIGTTAFGAEDAIVGMMRFWL